VAKVDIENKTGIPVLDAIIQGTSNTMGFDLSGADYGNIECFTSGSMQLDLALKVGGLPSGRVIEIFGPESSMKTSFCLQAIAAKQQARLLTGTADKRDLFVDLEHSLTRDFIEGFGIRMDQVIWVRPNSAEEALQVSIDYVKSGAIDCVLIDSVDAMQNEKQQRRQIGENDVGGISKEMSNAMRQISKLAPHHGTTYFFINQIRMNPGVMFGSPETTPGGNALKFYATLRLKCMTRQPCAEIPNATTFRIKIVKSKMGGDYTETLSIPFIYGKGFAQALDIEAVAKELKILRHSAGQTKIMWVPDTEFEPLLPDIEKGKEAGQQALVDTPWLLEKLRQACFLHANADCALSANQILSMGSPNELSETQVKSDPT
jgi:recombination protein RecA